MGYSCSQDERIDKLEAERDDLTRRLEEARTQLVEAQRDHKARADSMAKELDQHKPSHDYRPMSVDVGECQRWRCEACGRESKAPVRAAYDPCPKGKTPCAETAQAELAEAERRAVEAERAVGVSVGIEESREGLMRKQNERIQKAEQRAEKAERELLDTQKKLERVHGRLAEAERERDGLKLRVRMADMRDGELAKAKDRIEELEASGSSDGSALGDVLIAADECEQKQDDYGLRQLLFVRVRRYRKERGDVDND